MGRFFYSKAGTPNYAAPEILKNPPRYTSKADMWSLGLVLLDLLTLTNNYDMDSVDFLNERIPKIPTHYDPFLVGIVTKLLVKDVDKRPSSKDLLSTII